MKKEIRRMQINIYERPDGDTRIEYKVKDGKGATVRFCVEVFQVIQNLLKEQSKATDLEEAA